MYLIYIMLSLKTPPLPAPAHRILIVDDEPAVLFAYQRLIEREGLVVDISESLEHAISQVRTHRYKAVISDIRLAGSDNSDGLIVFQTVRNVWPDTNMILITGSSTSELEQAACDLGVTHYLHKPVMPSTILDILHRLCNAPEHIIAHKA